MLTDRTLISIVVPTYNCGKFISEAIESILNQTYKNIEIIVIDDGSTDNTKEVLKEYIACKKLKYFYQNNTGPSAARNRGVKEAEGEYIAFLDADDLWENNKLEKSLNFLKKNNFDWICTSMTKFNEDGTKFIKRIPDDSFALDYKTKEIKQLRNGIFFFGSVAVHTPTIIAKKECFEKVGLFDESFCICEDTDLWLRFEETGLKGGYLDEPLTIYRYNENGLTKRGRIDTLGEGSKVARKHAHILGMNNKSIRDSYGDFLWQTADIYWTNQKYTGAMKYILKSLYYKPNNIVRIFNKLTFQSQESLWKK